jgi:predicted nucleic acid-binding Zn finger protein
MHFVIPTFQRNKSVFWVALKFIKQLDKYLLTSHFQQPCERGTTVILIATKGRAGCQQLMPVILATQEAKIRRITV